MEKPGPIEFAATVATRLVFVGGMALLAAAAGEKHAATHVSDQNEQASIEHEADVEFALGGGGIVVGGALIALAARRRGSL